MTRKIIDIDGEKIEVYFHKRDIYTIEKGNIIYVRLGAFIWIEFNLRGGAVESLSIEHAYELEQIFENLKNEPKSL